MTDQELDDLLRQVAVDALLLDYEDAKELPEPEPTPQHQKQMRAMLRDPLAWSRRKPAWLKPLCTAAMLLLVTALTFACVMLASPTARATVKNWFMVQTDTDVIYTYTTSENSTDAPNYTLGYIPDGYTLYDSFTFPGHTSITYACSTGQKLFFDCFYATDETLLQVSTVDAVVEQITFNGHSGTLFISQVSTQSNMLTWIDEEANVQFVIDGFFDKKELFAIANNIVNN
jgi:hypothetical protein